MSGICPDLKQFGAGAWLDEMLDAYLMQAGTHDEIRRGLSREDILAGNGAAEWIEPLQSLCHLIVRELAGQSWGGEQGTLRPCIMLASRARDFFIRAV